MNTLTLQTIPRVKAGCTAITKTETRSPLEMERIHLADKAAAILGYHALKADTMGQKTMAAVTGPLTGTLLQLEIETLDVNSVIAYQLDEMTRRNRQAIEERFSDYVAGWFSFGTWLHTALGDYQRPVPEFVIDKAIRIKEACPQVQFFIQHLSDPKADPFLVAKLEKEVYYIDAWDEPRFESSL
jgi:hypothetical protein